MDETVETDIEYVEDVVASQTGETFAETELGHEVYQAAITDELTDALHEGDLNKLSRAAGVHDHELSGSSLRLATRLLDRLDRDGSPVFVSIAGNPDSGKTNTGSLLAELRLADIEDGEVEVLSNARGWSIADQQVTSAHDLAVELIRDPDQRSIVLIDEGSTHFDARTHSRAVSQQWTPFAKRMAKIDVDLVVIVGHTGKDLHPEIKRLTNLGVWKTDKKTAEFYSSWDGNDDTPSEQLFGGDVGNLQKTAAEYDPDDSAPWAWDLESDLFSKDLSWPELYEELVDRGPAI